MDTFEVDTVVVGAGVIGLAAARALAMAGRDVLIVEKNAAIGSETSARNSEVIHAGIYYEPGSSKSRHCVRGRKLLYAYCQNHSVPFRQCGKLIVATNEFELEKLSRIAQRAQANSVDDLRLIDRKETLSLEPSLRAEAALFSPSTGIIDSHSLMISLLGEAEAHGAQLAVRAEIQGGEIMTDGMAYLDIGGAQPIRLKARSFINCAGLWAPCLSARIRGLPEPPKLAFVKGSYFSCGRKTPFSHLIYPVPQDGGLGVHLTLDLAGRAKFGPDTEWLPHDDPAMIDYSVSSNDQPIFAEAIRKYWPDLLESDLHPDYAGVRPKLTGSEYPDFRFLGPDELNGPHVMLYGIESPGLTASLSIAAEIADWLT